MERLWNERNNTQWGLPNKNFNELDGLLLLDDDDDDDGDASQLEGTKDTLEYLDSSSITLESDTEVTTIPLQLYYTLEHILLSCNSYFYMFFLKIQIQIGLLGKKIRCRCYWNTE